MNELEKIQAAKTVIKAEHEKIKTSMLLLVKMLGGEVEPIKGRTYKTTEDTGVSCTIEAFLIEDEVLKVKANFDGDVHILELDSFNAEELADILYLMIKENKNQLKHRIDTLFTTFITENECEPLYASCCIKYLDDQSELDVYININGGIDYNDDLIHYYCNHIGGLKSLCEIGVEDFIVVNVYELLETI